MEIIENKIRSYIFSRYPLVEAKRFENDAPLAGVLDSLAVLGLIGYIEPEFSVQVSPSDLTDENFESIFTIASLVHRLKQSSG